MALIIRLGSFNWEEDRIDAVEKASKQKHPHQFGRICIYSKLTILGWIRYLFKIKKAN